MMFYVLRGARPENVSTLYGIDGDDNISVEFGTYDGESVFNPNKIRAAIDALKNRQI